MLFGGQKGLELELREEEDILIIKGLHCLVATHPLSLTILRRVASGQEPATRGRIKDAEDAETRSKVGPLPVKGCRLCPDTKGDLQPGTEREGVERSQPNAPWLKSAKCWERALNLPE